LLAEEADAMTTRKDALPARAHRPGPPAHTSALWGPVPAAGWRTSALARTARAALAAVALAATGLLGACTAGSYEIPDCSVVGETMAGDSCQALNQGNTGCMLYQCDTGTKQCVQRPRDYDRDGDPDRACGGTDCDDRKASVSGLLTGTCECTPDALKQTCSTGEGACLSPPVQYRCENGSLACPAVARQPQDYNSRPDVATGSWDYNCDMKIDSACCYQNANGSRICDACAQLDCKKIAGLAEAIAAKDPTRACDLYCATYPDAGTKCPPDNSLRIVRCGPDCGSDIALCYCHFNAGLPLITSDDKCERQGDKTPVLDKVNCR
jgi:hypothetical protein